MARGNRIGKGFTLVESGTTTELVPIRKILYLAESAEKSVLKVGLTVKPLQRMGSLAANSPFRHSAPFRMLGFSVGTVTDERNLLGLATRHTKPKRREWFAWSEELLSILAPHFPLSRSEAHQLLKQEAANAR